MCRFETPVGHSKSEFVKKKDWEAEPSSQLAIVDLKVTPVSGVTLSRSPILQKQTGTPFTGLETC